MQRPVAPLADEAFDASLPPDLLRLMAKLPIQLLRTRHDLRTIAYTDGIATVMIDAPLLQYVRFKNAKRHDPARLRRLREQIATRGYVPTTPVICRIGQKGKWIVVDGGHRLTALHQLYRKSLWYRIKQAAWRLGGRLPGLKASLDRVFGLPDRVYCILFLGYRSNRLR